MQRHRNQKLIRLLNGIERQVPAGKVIHVILDNYAAHKHPNVRKWLTRHPRWTFHFTPTSCSWLNAVETHFSALTRRRVKRGVFRSIVELQTAITHYIAGHNDDPKPFTWAKAPGPRWIFHFTPTSCSWLWSRRTRDRANGEAYIAVVNLTSQHLRSRRRIGWL